MTLQPTIKIVLDIELYAVVKSHCKEQGQMSQLVRKLLREYFIKKELAEVALDADKKIHAASSQPAKGEKIHPVCWCGETHISSEGTTKDNATTSASATK